MHFSESKEIAESLRRVSRLVLAEFDIPDSPGHKTRKWRNGQCAIGVAYHWTGGPDILRTLRWFNHPAWGNAGSSCHAVIGDTLDGPVGDLWSRHAPADLQWLFPAPTLLIAPMERGTWATNWTNDRTLGVENRNLGHLVSADAHSARQRDYAGVSHERYTREQITSNINVGRMVAGIASKRFDPDWVIGHSMVNARKSDPGPDFPLHLVRLAIEADAIADELPWLDDYPTMESGPPALIEAHDADTERDDTPHWGAMVIREAEETEEELTRRQIWAQDCLYAMGFNCGSASISVERIRRFVTWFQISTAKWKTNRCRANGSLDRITVRAIKRRMHQLRLPEPTPAVMA